MGRDFLPTGGMSPDTAGRFPPGRGVRHTDTGIRGSVVRPWRFYDRESGVDGRDYVRVKWHGGGVETDEPTQTLEPFAA